MSEIKVSAKTVDDAITEAAIQLGISSDQIEYDVVSRGSSGFLGLGSKKAVILAREKSEDNKKVEKVEEVEKTEEVEEAIISKEQVKKEPIKLAIVSDKIIEETEKFLVDVIKAMGMEVEVQSVVDKEGALAIELKGNNMGILIGKRGQTLDSLQYLANRVANKKQDGYIRVKLDTENYREKRKATLENLGKNLAFKVKRTKKSVSLEPMNPYERRIIHSVLQNDPNISTHSEGEEPYRRVVITLAKKN